MLSAMLNPYSLGNFCTYSFTPCLRNVERLGVAPTLTIPFTARFEMTYSQPFMETVSKIFPLKL